jgi:hypothetical protein
MHLEKDWLVEMVSEPGPIAQKLIKELRGFRRRKTLDFKQLDSGRRISEELQKTVAPEEEPVKLDPAHAVYVYAQNQAAVLSEQMTQLPVMSRFMDLVGKAEGDNMDGRVGVPRKIQTDSRYFYEAFKDALAEIGISSACFEHIPALERIRRSFADYLDRGGESGGAGRE